jgi:hypothetical protein
MIERFIEALAFLRSYDPAPRRPPPHRKTKKDRQFADRRGMCGRGRAWSRIRRPQYSFSIIQPIFSFHLPVFFVEIIFCIPGCTTSERSSEDRRQNSCGKRRGKNRLAHLSLQLRSIRSPFFVISLLDLVGSGSPGITFRNPEMVPDPYSMPNPRVPTLLTKCK